MRASVCVGDYATIPYCVARLGISVYSMEELCYCIRENAYLLDTSLMNDELLRWIDRECGLRQLAEELYPLVHKRGSLSDFVTMIMEYTGFYSSEYISEIAGVLKQGAGLSSIEKRKSQIDYLVKKKRYVSAIRDYDELLAKWKKPEEMEEALPAPSVRAAILHNKGVAYTGLMLYQQAADIFEEAYRLDAQDDYMKSYLAAKRMQLSDGEYIAFAAEVPGSFQISLELEKNVEQAKAAWKQQVDYQRLQQRASWRGGSDKQKYYDENDRLTKALKAEYRMNVQE